MPFRSHMLGGRAALDRDSDPCCIINHQFRILFCNRAWDAFAAENGGGAAAYGNYLQGRDLTYFIPEVLREFYSRNLKMAMHGGMWSHVYECSSPNEFRLYKLQTLALTDAGELLLCHTRVLVSPHTRAPVDPKPVHFIDGTVGMCSHCRVTRSRGDGNLWEWVPEFLARPPERREDLLCPACSRYYRTGDAYWN